MIAEIYRKDRMSLKSIGSGIISLASVLLLVAAFEQPAYAYIDPGTGALVLQVLMGGLAGAAVVLKMYWNRLSVKLGFRKETAQNDKDGRLGGSGTA